ncbi:MAG: DciA family protein [Acidobacteria bacterium]|nr:DciA family protein [Acidobacteriota bacterium]
MERAGRLIRKLDSARKCSSPEQLCLAAWPSAVGRNIAVHTRAVGVFEGRMVIEVEDATWQRQLSSLNAQILGNLERMLAERLVSAIDYRVRAPRLMPKREERKAGHFDEADHITDPVFQLIYKTARKKATA